MGSITTRSLTGGMPVTPFRLPFLLLLTLTLTTSAPLERSQVSSSSPSLEDVDSNFAPNRCCPGEEEGDHRRHHQQQQCERPTSSPFRIIVDGGSTGSRLHVFEFVHRPSRGRDRAHDAEAETVTVTETETVVVRRGSAKAWTPLSAYAPSPLDDDGDEPRPPPLDPRHVASHLIPAFEYAASVVPERYHRLTTVRYQATAGMRLLSESDQRLVYDALHEGLMGATLEFEVEEEGTEGGKRRRVVPFPFSLRREDVSTLDGRMEGLYGAVAANYLAGRIDADLHLLMPPGHRSPPRHQQQRRQDGRRRSIDAGAPIHEPAQECPNLDTDDAAGPKGGDDVDRDGNHHHHHGPYGALDMGGSSTQLVFHPGDDAEGANSSSSGSSRVDDDEKSCEAPPRPPRTCRARYSNKEGGSDGGGVDGSALPLSHPERERPAPPTGGKRNGKKRRKLDGNEFFSTSYLSYGVDQFRERLWDLWVTDADSDAIRHKEHGNDDSSGGFQSEEPRRLDNPCGFPGHEVTWRNATLVGTGDASACADEVRRLLPGQRHRHRDRDGHVHGDESHSGVVGGVRHPPLRGKFYAMSLYFFTLDCLRVLSHPDDPTARAELDRAWPTPTLRQLGDALDGFCSRSWHGDLSPLLEDGDEFVHPFTRPSVLPHRCAEAVYMVTLLRDGFGFDPDARDITFAYDVDGSEVEWTLGMALSNRAEEMAGAEASDGAGGEDAPSGRRRRDTGLFSWMEYLFSPSASDGDGRGTIGGGEGVGLASAYFLDMFGSYSMNPLSSSATPVPCGCGVNGTSDEGNGLGGTGGAGGDGGVGRVGLASAYFLDMFGYYSMDRRLETFRPEPGV